MNYVIVKSLCISIDFVSIVICLLLIFDFGTGTVLNKTYDKKLFNYLVTITASLLFFDALSWGFIDTRHSSLITFLITATYYALHLYICTIWVMYTYYVIYDDEEKTKKVGKILLIPTVLITILSYSSYFYPFLFTITINNKYQRGVYYLPFIVLCMLYLHYTVLLIFFSIYKNRKNNKKTKKLYILCIYPTLPLIGVIVQTLSYGVNITWLLTVVSLLIIYFNFQNSQLILDPLTKISNRYRFDSFLDKHFLDIHEEKKIYLAIIDLNRFKLINDKYGHLEGDKVLVDIAKILSTSINSTDFVARLGGDEFVIFGYRKNKSEVENLLTDIQNAVCKYNDEESNSYNVSLSIGYSMQNNTNSKTKNQMMIEADNNMYNQKKCSYVDSNEVSNHR